MEVFIRCDGSPVIGMGHITRMVALATALSKKDLSPYFVIRNLSDNVLKYIHDHGFKIYLLPAQQDSFHVDFTLEFEKIKELVENRKSCLIIDHYGYTAEMFSVLKKHVDYLVLVDDFQPERINEHVDIVINPSFSAYKTLYPLYKNTVYLLGTHYALLRDQFLKVRNYSVNQDCNKIMICFGGSDTARMTVPMIELLSEMNKNFSITAVIGSENDLSLFKLQQSYPNVTFKTNIKNMALEMSKHDLIVSSASTITLESSALGIPTAVMCCERNQEEVYEVVTERMLCFGLGYAKDYYHNRNKIKEKLHEFISNFNLRREFSIQSQKLVNKEGTSAVAREICDHFMR